MAAKFSTQKVSKYNTDYLNKAGNTYEDVINDKDCARVIKSITNRFTPYMDEDDIQSLINFAIMDTCRKYDPNHSLNVRFTTFLHQQISFKLSSFLYKSKKKYLKHKKFIKEAMYSFNEFDSSQIEYNAIVSLLNEEDKVFIEDKFINNLSTIEMSEKYKISQEEVRKRYKKIIHLIKTESGVSVSRTNG